VENVTKSYKGPDGIDRTVVDDLYLEHRAGETLVIVGETGTGKSTTAAIALALTVPDSGRVLFEGSPWSDLREKDRRPVRRRIASVSQDPLGSFDPRRNVGQLIASALRVSDRGSNDVAPRVASLLADVGLPAGLEGRHPLTLSGGQRQRVAIARALATDPDVLVLDEAVSALDVSVQAQVLDLLADIRAAYGVASLFISHDLGVIHHVSDRVLVLKDGRVVEEGDAERVFRSPREEYTRRLIEALPRLGGADQLGTLEQVEGGER
ncbi:MAG: transporter ATP-binding protein, partial [Frondihabitans sp.]|nr:transporter ATP-binding protein [Frondihabitans sp.]